MSGMGWNDEFDFPGRALASKRDRVVWVNAVTPGFFATYGTPLRAGRDFDGGDRGGAGNVVIVNEAFVRKYFTDRNPIGEAVHRAGFPGHPAVDATIVGVVGNAAYRSLREPLAPIVYMPLAQLPEAEQMAGLAVRVAAGSPLGVRRSLGAALQRVDPRLTLTFRPLSEQVDAALTQERLIAMLSGFFGGLALLLAAIGLYGVTSYTVARRRNEIGIRMALGADPRHVIRLIVGRAALLVCLGVAIGGALSLWASRFVATMLFGLQPRDPATFAGAAVVLAVIGALAAWIPARRGSRIDPACVLREG
jgi:predicted permease